MRFVNKKIKWIKSLNNPAFIGFICGKFLFGFGLGLILASRWVSIYWMIFGWILLCLSILVHIPTIKKLVGG